MSRSDSYAQAEVPLAPRAAFLVPDMKEPGVGGGEWGAEAPRRAELCCAQAELEADGLRGSYLQSFSTA